MTHGLAPEVHLPGSGERFAGAGGDEMTLRVETDGSDPITVVEAASNDTDPVTLHSHPWDELVYVLDGEMSFTCGDRTAVGGAGTLATLPRGVPHTLHVTLPPARYLMITVGAPSAEFLREVGRVYAGGPTLERLVAVARRHGVEAAFPVSGEGEPPLT